MENDTLNQAGDTGPGTIVGLGGDDTITVGTGLASVTGDSGNDSVLLQASNTGAVSGGTEMTASSPAARSARSCCSAAPVSMRSTSRPRAPRRLSWAATTP